MKRFFRENGLSLVLLALFLITWLFGQAIAGHRESNNERMEHGQAPETLGEYLTSAHFLEATAENWESEFLQMSVYVMLTVFLFQKGSSESKALDKAEPVDRDPRKSRRKASAPWPVRRGGVVLVLYEYSLSIAFLLLFLFCIAVHGVSGCANYNEELVQHGQAPISCGEYLSSSRFWFESLQNWQSEFLAILSMVVLSIFLRQRGSPESKPVDAPHSETGE
ncbi:MAG: hypothetical protein B7Z47_03190 [Chthoniobacter sp. 12-60-6]|nr:MAG: hypothetical protein B7Z47_03190 [Chthoniobacter sp. 12-60-6]